MPNTLGRKDWIFFLSLAFLCSFFAAPENMASPMEGIQKAILDKFEETSTPVFDPKEADQEQPKQDPFFDKIRKKRNKFEKKEQKRQREFVQELREKRWTGEQRQKKLKKFNAGKIERRQNFLEKQQEKIEDHLEEG